MPPTSVARPAWPISSNQTRFAGLLSSLGSDRGDIRQELFKVSWLIDDFENVAGMLVEAFNARAAFEKLLRARLLTNRARHEINASRGA
jgi:hypothetical protein